MRSAVRHMNAADAQARAVSRMPNCSAAGAPYRAALTREMRIHAALGIPSDVSDGPSQYCIVLPGLPRMVSMRPDVAEASPDQVGARAMAWLSTTPDMRGACSPMVMIACSAITPLVHVFESLESGAFV